MTNVTTKNIIVENIVTGEEIVVGTSQRFTKSVLMNVIHSGKYAQFLIKALEDSNEGEDFAVKYIPHLAVQFGNFARIKYV